MLNTPSCVKDASCVHLQWVYVVAIRKIASLKDDYLEIDICSMINVMAVIYCHEVLQGPLVGAAPLLIRYDVSCVALVPQLQFWYLHWPFFV
jgi:hypothetical protein